MSFLANREIPCTTCRLPNDVEVWAIVNIKEDPELKDLLLGGELNLAECRSCKKIFYAESFLLYHDPDSELLAFVYPYDEQSNRVACEEKTREDFERSQKENHATASLAYGPRTFFGVDELARLIEQEDEERIQGEIVFVLAAQEGMDVLKLRPSVARRQSIPFILPLQPGLGSFRESVVEGLARIERVNDRLSVYKTLHEGLVGDPGRSVDRD